MLLKNKCIKKSCIIITSKVIISVGIQLYINSLDNTWNL